MNFLADSNCLNFFKKLVPQINPKSINAVISLVGDGATVPFIARYRKEMTGALDEVQVRDVINTYELWNEVQKRKEFVLSEIEKQGNLTSELDKQIKFSFDLAEIEELYRPFKRKKKTKATLAREAGLEPLAQWIWDLGQGTLVDSMTIEVKAKEYTNVEKGFVTYEEVLRGAQHIIIEKLASDLDLRKSVRDEYQENGKITCQPGPKYKANSKFEMYQDYSESIKSLSLRKASHRYLALRRGWQEGELKVNLTANDEHLLVLFKNKVNVKLGTQVESFLALSAKTALTVHVLPSIANEIHKQLKTDADEHAIQVFTDNVRKVLMASPFGAKVVLGIDPGIRTGCKVALIDKGGNFISHTVIHTNGEASLENTKKLFQEVLKNVKIEGIAVGNGTAGRETEEFIRKVLKEIEREDIPVVLVNESGASIYSASDVARQEFPDLDLTVRGAISIARRLQDPLAELVKIEPKSIGVGQYQHDVSQPQLKKSLHDVVESCVNNVGVDVNTASESLLQYIAGIGPALAKNIVLFRKDKGLFKSRQQLLDVPHFSAKVFEQSAGFLRVSGGEQVLDSTGIHPERYGAVLDMAKESSLTVSKLLGHGKELLGEKRAKWIQLVGEYTFDDILKELDAPGRDPRDIFKIFKFRDDIHEVKDLKENMVCPGVVTNVTNFGAFVDVGVHQDGLVHISELAHQFVDDPRKVVSPGDQVQVKVLKVDTEKNQISLSMLFGDKPQVKELKKGGERSQGQKGGKKFGKGKSKEAGDRKNQRGKKPPGKSQGSRTPKPAFNNPFASAFGDLTVSKK